MVRVVWGGRSATMIILVNANFAKTGYVSIPCVVSKMSRSISSRNIYLTWGRTLITCPSFGCCPIFILSKHLPGKNKDKQCSHKNP